MYDPIEAILLPIKFMTSLSFLTTLAPTPYAIPAMANTKAMIRTIESMNGDFKIP